MTLFLDDDHMRIYKFQREYPGAYIAKTAKDAIELLRTHEFSVVCLDHDLKEEHYGKLCYEGTGQEVAHFISTMDSPPKVVTIHSYNDEGANLMFELLAGKFGGKIERRLFDSEDFWRRMKEVTQ